MKKTSILNGLVIVSSLALAPMVASAQSDGPQGLAYGNGAEGSVGTAASTIRGAAATGLAAVKSGNETVFGLHGKFGQEALDRGVDDPHGGQ